MDFLKYRWIYFTISAFLLVGAVFALAYLGLKPAIDFTGGALVELSFNRPPGTEQLREKIPAEVNVSQLQKTGAETFLIRFPGGKEEREKIVASLSEFSPETQRFEVVGPTFGRTLLRRSIIAMTTAVGLILIYVSWRFGNWRFGAFAVIAMLHDNLILIGSFALLGHWRGVEVGSLFITAALTTLAASVHDTVVTFDYIRKQAGDFSDISNLKEVVNKALNETIVRNLNNSWTIIFTLTAILLLGGETVKWFAAALLIGNILATYSSTFLAVPLLLVGEQWRRKE